MANSLDTWPAGATAFMDVTYTQVNAAGGAIVCEITPGVGQEFILMAVRQVNSGTNSINITLETAAGGTIITALGFVASGAGTNYGIGVGTMSTTQASAGLAGLGYPMIVSGTQTIRVFQGGAGAQNDTMRVLMNVRVKLGAMPTVIHTNSTNPANVSVTAGAESFTVI